MFTKDIEKPTSLHLLPIASKRTNKVIKPKTHNTNRRLGYFAKCFAIAHLVFGIFLDSISYTLNVFSSNKMVHCKIRIRFVWCSVVWCGLVWCICAECIVAKCEFIWILSLVTITTMYMCIYYIESCNEHIYFKKGTIKHRTNCFRDFALFLYCW